jgi:hypothetical protein
VCVERGAAAAGLPHTYARTDSMQHSRTCAAPCGLPVRDSDVKGVLLVVCEHQGVEHLLLRATWGRLRLQPLAGGKAGLVHGSAQ